MAEHREKHTQTDKELKFSSEEIYARYFERVFAYMSARLPEREAALECAQEVFLQFLKTNPDPTSIRTNITSYIYGIAGNVVADFLKSRNRSKPRSIGNLDQIPGKPDVSPIDIHRLNICLEKLKEVDKKILILHFWEGKRHTTIASELGMSSDQVRQRFHRALKKLKKFL